MPAPWRPRHEARGRDPDRHRQDQPQLLVGAPARREAGQVRQGRRRARAGLSGPRRNAESEGRQRRARKRPGPGRPRPGWPWSATRISSPTGTCGLSGNANFFLNIVNWLTEEADLISIQPRTSSPRTIQIEPLPGPAPVLRLGHPPAAGRARPGGRGLAAEEVAVKFGRTLVLLGGRSWPSWPSSFSSTRAAKRRRPARKREANSWTSRPPTS